MEIKSIEITGANTVPSTSIDAPKREVTLEDVKNLLCEYVGTRNYSLVKHVERGLVYAKDTKSVEDFMTSLMQSMRAQIVGQLNSENNNYSTKVNAINNVFEAVTHTLRLLHAEDTPQSKNQLAAFLIGTLLKFVV
jgi:hypothetical protein